MALINSVNSVHSAEAHSDDISIEWIELNLVEIFVGLAAGMRARNATIENYERFLRREAALLEEVALARKELTMLTEGRVVTPSVFRPDPVPVRRRIFLKPSVSIPLAVHFACLFDVATRLVTGRGLIERAADAVGIQISQKEAELGIMAASLVNPLSAVAVAPFVLETTMEMNEEADRQMNFNTTYLRNPSFGLHEHSNQGKMEWKLVGEKPSRKLEPNT